MPAKPLTRVVGYTRVSTEEQARDGVSLKAQREKVIGYAALYDLDLVELVEDAGESAKSLKRPGLAHVLQLLDTGQADGLVIAKLDRLTRSVRDLATLIDCYFSERAGKQLFSVGDSIDTRTAAGRLVLNVLISVAQWEREVICERTKAGLDFKRSRNERISRYITYGWSLDADGKSLLPVLEEQIVLHRIYSARQSGLSLRKIAARLNDAGIASRTGVPWTASTIQKILSRQPATEPINDPQAPLLSPA
jgi:site-specific DNA recombinase